VAKDDKKKRRKTTAPPAAAPELDVLQASLERERKERADEADNMAQMLIRMGELEAELRKTRGGPPASADNDGAKEGAGSEKVERDIIALLERMAELEEKSAGALAEIEQLRSKQQANAGAHAAQPKPESAADSAGLAEELERALRRSQGLERHIDQQQREIVGLKLDLEEARMRLKRAEESGPTVPRQIPDAEDSGPTLQETELSEAEEQVAMLTGFMSDLGETVADFLSREEQYFAFRKAVLEDIQLAVMEKLGPQHETATPPPLPNMAGPIRRLSSAAIDISQIAEMLESMRPPALGGGRLSREMMAIRKSVEMAAVARGDDIQPSPRILLGPEQGAAPPRAKSEAPDAAPAKAQERASQAPASQASRRPSKAPSRAPAALRGSVRPKESD
jgi:hypothetical protein